MSGFCSACLRFLFVFLLLFSQNQMVGVERMETGGGGTISNSASQTSTPARLSHYANLRGSWKTYCVREGAVVHSVGCGHFARLVKWVIGNKSWKSVREQMVLRSVEAVNWTEMREGGRETFCNGILWIWDDSGCINILLWVEPFNIN